MSELSTPAATRPPVGDRGCVIVGDYLDTPAGAAARAVRRVGLTPGLDRQFGGEAHTIGLVVAQEPHAGSEAPRGAMVTLYVSAPGAGESEREGRHQLEPGIETDVQPAAAPSGTSGHEGPRRRRRRGRSSAGVLREPAPPQVRPAMPPPEPSLSAGDELTSPEGEYADASGSESEWGQLGFEMRDVFDTDTFGVSGRSLYPRMPLRLRMRGRWELMRGHRALVVLVCGLLALSAGVTFTRGMPVRGESPALVAVRAPHARRAAPTVTVAPAQTHRKQTRLARRRRGIATARRSGQDARDARRTPPQPGSAPIRAAADPQPQVVSAASEPAAKSGGGPFSP